MADRFDVIVVGGGHNGLVCAALLARTGKQVLVLEANDQVGGAAVTREFADGFAVSACAHLLYQLQPAVRKDLKLNPVLAAEDMTTIALGEDGDHVRIKGGTVAGVDDADADNYRDAQLARSVDAGPAGLRRPAPWPQRDARVPAPHRHEHPRRAGRTIREPVAQGRIEPRCGARYPPRAALAEHDPDLPVSPRGRSGPGLPASGWHGQRLRRARRSGTQGRL